MAGDLRRHDSHCEFTVMLIQYNIFQYDVVEQHFVAAPEIFW